MNTNQENLDRLKFFQKQIKTLSSKYTDKELSQAERYTALGEITVISESLAVFNDVISIAYSDESKTDIKTLALSITEDLKKFSSDIRSNIENNAPAAELY